MRRGSGFTLVELLVVIAIIGVLVALLLPAIQAAREAARRSHCLNNLKQLGIALQNYEGTKKQLPPGNLGYDVQTTSLTNIRDSSIEVETAFVPFVLPYLEEAALYSVYNFNERTQDQYNELNSPVGQKLATFQCPSDEPHTAAACNVGSGGVDWKGNYGINWGAWRHICQRPQAPTVDLPHADCLATTMPATLHVAPFHLGYGARFGQIADGLSKTLAMMEMIQPPGEATCDRRARIWCEKAGCGNITTFRSPNSSVNDEGHCQDFIDAPCLRIGGNNQVANTRSYTSSRSRHPGGVHVLMCDSSAHFLADNVELAVWQAMSTIAGDEVYQSPF